MSDLLSRIAQLCLGKGDDVEGLRALAEEVGSDVVVAAQWSSKDGHVRRAFHIACSLHKPKMASQLIDW